MSGDQNWSVEEPHGSATREGSPGFHPGIRRPTASNPRGNSDGSRPHPTQLDAGPHHRPA